MTFVAIPRRRALQLIAAGGLTGSGLRGVLAQGAAPAIVTHGVICGDVIDRRAIVWSRG